MADLDLRNIVDVLAGMLATLPAEQHASWLIGLCMRVDQAAGADVFDQALVRLVQALRERQAFDLWQGKGRLWDSNAPKQCNPGLGSC